MGFLQRVRTAAQADADGGGDPIRALQSPNGIQVTKMPIQKSLHMTLFKNEDIPIPVITAEIAAGGSGPIAVPVVDLGQDR